MSLLSQEITAALTSGSTDKIVEIDNNFNSVDEAARCARNYNYHNNEDIMHFDFVVRLNS